MTGWDGVSDFYEDDEPLEDVLRISEREPNVITKDPREDRGCQFTPLTGTCVAQPVCPPGTKICQPEPRA